MTRDGSEELVDGDRRTPSGRAQGLAVIETGCMRIAVARSGETRPRSRAEAIGARKPRPREREPRSAFPLASLRGAAYPSPYR